MNYLSNLIKQNNLLPADVIILRKKMFGMVNHFAVFLGFDRFKQPLFAANYTAGTKLIPYNELMSFMQTLEPQSIQKFQGTERDRQAAIKRALSKLGEKDYDYLENNCEHYATFVQNGEPRSPQAENAKEFGNVALGVLVFTALFSLLSDD